MTPKPCVLFSPPKRLLNSFAKTSDTQKCGLSAHAHGDFHMGTPKDSFLSRGRAKEAQARRVRRAYPRGYGRRAQRSMRLLQPYAAEKEFLAVPTA
jgi:hypothetical protein